MVLSLFSQNQFLSPIFLLPLLFFLLERFLPFFLHYNHIWLKKRHHLSLGFYPSHKTHCELKKKGEEENVLLQVCRIVLFFIVAAAVIHPPSNHTRQRDKVNRIYTFLKKVFFACESVICLNNRSQKQASCPRHHSIINSDNNIVECVFSSSFFLSFQKTRGFRSDETYSSMYFRVAESNLLQKLPQLLFLQLLLLSSGKKLLNVTIHSLITDWLAGLAAMGRISFFCQPKSTTSLHNIVRLLLYRYRRSNTNKIQISCSFFIAPFRRLVAACSCLCARDGSSSSSQEGIGRERKEDSIFPFLLWVKEEILTDWLTD